MVGFMQVLVDLDASRFALGTQTASTLQHFGARSGGTIALVVNACQRLKGVWQAVRFRLGGAKASV